jgi:phage tail protein X
MSIFAGLIAVASAVVAAEEKYFAPWAAAQLKAHLPKATAVTLPPAYGAVLLVNLVGATMVLIVLGMRVGKARKAHKVEVRCARAHARARACTSACFAGSPGSAAARAPRVSRRKTARARRQAHSRGPRKRLPLLSGVRRSGIGVAVCNGNNCGMFADAR